MKNITGIFILLLTICSCSKTSLAETYNKQETRIETFINNEAGKSEDIRVVHNNGSHCIVLKEGEGEELAVKGNLAFYYAGYIFSSGSLSASNLFTTNSKEIATGAKWNLEDEDCLPYTTTLDSKDMLPGLFNGLVGVKAGEECYIIFSGKYGFGKKQFGTVPANSALCYHIWVDTISND